MHANTFFAWIRVHWRFGTLGQIDPDRRFEAYLESQRQRDETGVAAAHGQADRSD